MVIDERFCQRFYRVWRILSGTQNGNLALSHIPRTNPTPTAIIDNLPTRKYKCEQNEDEHKNEIKISTALNSPLLVVDDGSIDGHSIAIEVDGECDEDMNEDINDKCNENESVSNLDDEIESNDGNKCPICLAEYVINDLVSQLPCQHEFHAGCIKQWLELQRSCPCCRHDVTTTFNK